MKIQKNFLKIKPKPFLNHPFFTAKDAKKGDHAGYSEDWIKSES